MADARDVRVCGRDREPLVFTFEFPGAEWYCVTCGGTEDLFGNRVANTPEIELRQALNAERYDRERAARRGDPEPDPWPRQGEVATDAVCGGCGRLPMIGTPLHDGKPPAWFSRTIDGVTVYACSTVCIPEKAEVNQW